MEKKYTVGGMTCSACVARVEKCVKNISGVTSVTVNLINGCMSVVSDEDKTAEIRAAVTAEGYTVKEGFAHRRGDEREKMLKKRLLISIPLVAVLMYAAMGSMIGIPVPWFLDAMNMRGAIYASAFQAVVAGAIIAVNFDYYKRGYKNLFKLKPNMDSLVALGSSVSFIYGLFAVAMIMTGHIKGDHDLMHAYMHNLYFEGAAMIVALITLGKFLEEKSKNKTTAAISKLLALAPDRAVIEVNGEEVEIAASQLKKGDTVILKDGFSVPCDGVVISGDGYADESALTGESMPVYKTEGDKVVCGTTFGGGSVKFTATEVGEDSTVYKIVKLVEDANSTKVPIAKIADTVAGYFVPAVMAIAIIALCAWLIAGKGVAFAVNAAVSVLVVSCPCALGLATPVALMVGTGKAAENGILVKSGEALQKLSSVDTVLLDKTGTLTANKPRVTDYRIFGDRAENEFFTLCASAEKPSSHPLAKPVIALAKEKGASVMQADNFEAIGGKGLKAEVGGKSVVIGNKKLLLSELDLEEDKAALVEKIADENATVLFVGIDGELAGYFTVEDEITPEARHAVAELKKMKMKVVMLTGDNERAAEKVAVELGIDYRAGVLPDDKYAEVVKYTSEGKKTLMIGDGVNDAPALSAAFVGMAIGAGTDIAVESADAVLIKSDLRDAVSAIKLGKAVMRNVKENLFWAFFYNVVLIPVACGVLYIPFGITLNPMLASAAMSLSSVSVVLNALRLNFFKTNKGEPYMKNKNENLITVYIDGMMCAHCVKRVTEIFASLGITAQVDLKKKRATFENADVSDEEIIKAISDGGYTVKNIVR